MHPVDKKNMWLASTMLLMATIIATSFIFNNNHYAIPLVVLFLIAFSNNMELTHRLVLMAVFVVISFSVMGVVDHFLSKDASTIDMSKGDYFYLLATFAGILLIIPLFFTYAYFIQLTATIKNAKTHYSVIENSPYLICTEHHTRTKEYSMLGYKGVKCRKGKKCLRKKSIVHAVRLVGLIGIIENGKSVNNDYYVTLWDHRYRKIRYGDYDIIEIHESKDVKDYDFIISKIIAFFTNEINKYKPINEVFVRVVGRPSIAENTKRLLQKHFLKVEYLVGELEEVEV